LEQLGGNQRDQIRNYRKYVENPAEGYASDEPPPVMKQVVIGDERFAERVLKKRRRSIDIERNYTLSDVEKAVCRVTKINREGLGRPQRTQAVNRARELFIYLARRHTESSLREIARRLRVRDISTVSHGDKRITMALQENNSSAKELKDVLNQTIHSFIQA
jgi:chromosomal replication initiation ATPase DnaA